MTAETLAAIAGILLSLIFSYIPDARAWFAEFTPEAKRLIMLVLLLMVAALTYGISCSGLWAWVSCDRTGLLSLVEAFVAAVIANQAAYMISPLPRQAEEE